MQLNINKFDKRNLNQVRAYLNTKFAEIEKETGLKMAIYGINFDDTSFDTKLTVHIPTDASEQGLDPYKLEIKNNLDKHGWKFGVTASDYGKKVSIRGTIHTVIGCKNRYQSNPIIVESKSGQTYKISEKLVKLNEV